MFLRILLIASLFFVLFTSCNDENNGPVLDFTDVEMVFTGTYNGAPFVRNRPYSYQGSRIRVSTFHFYASSISATVGSEETFALDEIEFINLALFQNDAAAEAGFVINIGRAPVDTYEGFSWGIGVDAELNSTTPDEYGMNHPLADPNLYEEDFAGYKFFELAGEVDFDSDGTYDQEFNFVYGFDTNFIELTSIQSLELLPDVTNRIEIEMDLNKILENITSIDFSTQTATSANPSDPIMLILKSNIPSSITVK